MALCTNQSGTWRNITSQCVNQSATWRTIVDGCVNQSGTWRCFGMTAPTVSLSASPSSIVQSSGTTSTLTWSTTRACSTSSNFGTSATSGTCSVSPSSTTTYSICAINCFATSATSSATVTVTTPTLGSSFGGGRLICRASSINWIVAPSSSEVARTWYGRNDAVTSAQQVSGCTGWFVPTCGQLQNPGYTCRSYWDSYASTGYWSSSEIDGGRAWCMGFNSGNPSNDASKGHTTCVRAFRCVTY